MTSRKPYWKQNVYYVLWTLHSAGDHRDKVYRNGNKAFTAFANALLLGQRPLLTKCYKRKGVPWQQDFGCTYPEYLEPGPLPQDKRYRDWAKRYLEGRA